MTGSAVYRAEYAWLPNGVERDVRITVEGGRIRDVGRAPGSGELALPGLVLPGIANTHSHAFHRALRGRTHADGGTFWTWRAAMYAVADRLDPDSYLALARATYAEMALAGITAVGEFHYLHHAENGVRYDDPNAMGRALIQAAQDAGIRLTLLDACYLAGGLDADGYRPLIGTQLRFGDGTADAWAERVAELGADTDTIRIAAAVHSVRAVPAAAIPTVAGTGRLLHVHLSEQRAENDQCRAFLGVTPTRLLYDLGALGARTTAVHATHLTDDDIGLVGTARTAISVCPTTERDLADGIGPARRLADAGSPLSLGSDQQAVIDPFEEARALEMDERLATGRRGRFTPGELVDALTSQGQRSLGWSDAGRIVRGGRADLVAVRLDTPRTAGSDPAQALLAATAADVHTVIVDGRVVVQEGRHVLGDIGRLLREAIEAQQGRE